MLGVQTVLAHHLIKMTWLFIILLVNHPLTVNRKTSPNWRASKLLTMGHSDLLSRGSNTFHTWPCTTLLSFYIGKAPPTDESKKKAPIVMEPQPTKGGKRPKHFKLREVTHLLSKDDANKLAHGAVKRIIAAESRHKQHFQFFKGFSLKDNRWMKWIMLWSKAISVYNYILPRQEFILISLWCLML